MNEQAGNRRGGDMLPYDPWYVWLYRFHTGSVCVCGYDFVRTELISSNLTR